MSTAQPETAGAATPGPGCFCTATTGPRAPGAASWSAAARRSTTPLIDWIEVATPETVTTDVRRARFDLLVLDGEAAKVGGMGLAAR